MHQISRVRQAARSSAHPSRHSTALQHQGAHRVDTPHLTRNGMWPAAAADASQGSMCLTSLCFSLQLIKPLCRLPLFCTAVRVMHPWSHLSKSSPALWDSGFRV